MDNSVRLYTQQGPWAGVHARDRLTSVYKERLFWATVCMQVSEMEEF